MKIAFVIIQFLLIISLPAIEQDQNPLKLKLSLKLTDLECFREGNSITKSVITYPNNDEKIETTLEADVKISPNNQLIIKGVNRVKNFKAHFTVIYDLQQDLDGGHAFEYKDDQKNDYTGKVYAVDNKTLKYISDDKKMHSTTVLTLMKDGTIDELSIHYDQEGKEIFRIEGKSTYITPDHEKK